MSAGLAEVFRDDGPEAARSAAPAPGAVTCQTSNYSTLSSLNDVQACHRRTVRHLRADIPLFIEACGYNNVGFLTLTAGNWVKDPTDKRGRHFVVVTDPKELQRRWNSFNTHVMKRYPRWLAITERNEKGGLHKHILIDCGQDIRNGFDFAKGRRQRSASRWLRSEWATLNFLAARYGFGCPNMLPLRKEAKVVASYVTNYVTKHIRQRLIQDKGVRLVQYSKNCLRAVLEQTPGEWLWEKKLLQVGRSMEGCSCYGKEQICEHFTKLFGPRWAYYLSSTILNEPLEKPIYPTVAHLKADGRNNILGALRAQGLLDTAVDIRCPTAKLDFEQGDDPF